MANPDIGQKMNNFLEANVKMFNFHQHNEQSGIEANKEKLIELFSDKDNKRQVLIDALKNL